MLQRITDLWPNILRSGGDEQIDSQETIIGENTGNNGEGSAILVNEAEILLEYRLLNWTRLMEVDNLGSPDSIIVTGEENPNDDNGYKWPLGPDVVEECNAVATLPAVDPDSWIPLFDPDDFNKAHGPLEIEHYRLPSDDLKTWADRAIRLRQSIVETAKIYDNESGFEDQQDIGRCNSNQQ